MLGYWGLEGETYVSCQTHYLNIYNLVTVITLNHFVHEG